jgi:hypothetical protein
MNKKTTQIIVACGILVCIAAAGVAFWRYNSKPVINMLAVEKIEVWTYPSFSYELTDEEIDEFLDIYYDSEYLGRTDGGTTPLHGVCIYYKNGESLSIHDAQSTVFELEYSDRRDDGVKTHKIDSPALLDFIKQLEKTHSEKQ